MTTNFFQLTLEELTEELTQKGFKKFHAQILFQWIYQKNNFLPQTWTNVSGKLKEHFHRSFNLKLPKVVWQKESQDGTLKFLVGFEDGQTVECVVIPAKERLTLCLSSQVGCAIGCRFCHTGTMGLKRNLEVSEMIGQFMLINQWLTVNKGKRLTNIVYMGQGEPLHNFENVKKVTKLFLEEKGIGLGQRKVTLSTSGLVPQIEKLFDFPPINIAISLHAAHNNIRSELMPINKAYDLERLFQAIKKIPLKAHRRITYEYILIDQFNDRAQDVEGLIELLDPKESKINLIPFNEYPESRFKRPSNNRIQWFRDQLIKAGYVCTVRTTMGEDILAACGQLKSVLEQNMSNNL